MHYNLLFARRIDFLLICCFSGTANGNSEGNSGDVRNIQGVMRTGLFASGLMLAGESAVQLVLLSVDKPTVTLLHDVVNSLSNELPVRHCRCCSLLLFVLKNSKVHGFV